MTRDEALMHLTVAYGHNPAIADFNISAVNYVLDSLIQTERDLLTCMVYIDLNPVRAHMVSDAKDYLWSSHAHYLGLRTDRLITPHALYWALGNTPFAREAAYAELVHQGVAADQQGALTDATLSGWALGDAAFMTHLQTQTPRRLLKAKPGRPAKRQG